MSTTRRVLTLVSVLSALSSSRVSAQEDGGAQATELAPTSSPSVEVGVGTIAADPLGEPSAQAQAADPAVPTTGAPASRGEGQDAASEAGPGGSTPPLPPLAEEPSLQELSAAELENLGLAPGSGGLDTSIHFSGFSDFTAYVPIRPDGVTGYLLPRHTSFYVGNLNLYVTKNLSESFRTMGEVRFTYLPNGTGSVVQPDGTTAPFYTLTSDYAENGRAMRWGGVIIQRIYLEWTLHNLLTARAGQFLTPYGIWNVDHGSPAYIPVQRPYAINNNLFPERQTGLELFGRWDATNYSVLGYHLTLSNGTGSISEYRDLDSNKAVGGRAYWENRRLGFLRIGASGYYGRETNGVTRTSVQGTSVKLRDDITIQYDALALGADLLFKFKGMILQGEWVSLQRRYTKEGRTAHNLTLGPVPTGFSSDSLSWGAYGLAAYQFSWFGLTPYVLLQYNSEIRATSVYDRRLITKALNVGLNVHPIDAVTFKAEYQHALFDSGHAFFNYPLRGVQFQAAWAF